MAKRKNNFILPSSTKVDVVARRGEEIIVKEMTLIEVQNIKKKRVGNTIYFRSDFILTKTIKNDY